MSLYLYLNLLLLLSLIYHYFQQQFVSLVINVLVPLMAPPPPPPASPPPSPSPPLLPPLGKVTLKVNPHSENSGRQSPAVTDWKDISPQIRQKKQQYCYSRSIREKVMKTQGSKALLLPQIWCLTGTKVHTHTHGAFRC